MTSALRIAFALGSAAACGLAQSGTTQYVITTAAGSAPVSGDNGPATSALLRAPQFVAVDWAGSLYISEQWGYAVRKVTPDGIITTVAGTGVWGSSSDGGQAAASNLGNVEGVALDSSGTLYFADSSFGRVRKITPSGVLTTVAGTGVSGYSGDGGLATQAQFNYIQGIAFDRAGNLYIADSSNHRIRKVGTNGVVTTVAGNGSAGYGGDGGPATAARLNSPNDVVLDASGNLYIADRNNQRIRKVTPDGTISTYAGTGTSGLSGDGGSASTAQLANPTGLTMDSAGRLYITSNSFRVRRITATASSTLIETVVGNGTGGFQGDGGLALNAELDLPCGLTLDASGDLYMAEGGISQRIREVTAGGIISTVAGATHFAGDGGPAVAALLSFPEGVAADASGNVYIADTSNLRIRQITPDGKIRTLAGNGIQSTSGDGAAAIAASLNTPVGVAVDSVGNVYAADAGNNRIRRISPPGIITTIAGTGTAGATGDSGPATSATLNGPTALVVDSHGNIFIADQGNNRIRKVDAKGIITTVAGTGTAGSAGDGGPATAAQLNVPDGVALDSAGNLYIADRNNYCVRKVDSNGVITTIAGIGVQGFSGDGGPATAATMRWPTGIAVDGAGNVIFGDLNNGRIRMVDPYGVITTIAGTGTLSYSGDGGLATAATLGGVVPSGLALGPGGVVYFTDYANMVVRKLVPNAPSQVKIVFGNNQSGQVGTQLPAALVVSVQGSTGVPIAGVTVSFAVTSGSAQLSATSNVTAANGQAGVSVTLGATAGTVAVTASVPGAISAVFNLTATPTPVITGPPIPDRNYIATIAGTDHVFGVPVQATKASLGAITSVSSDAAGNIYLADVGRNLVLKISPMGSLDTLLGKASKFDTRSDLCSRISGLGVSLWWPNFPSSLVSVAAGADGNVYAVESDSLYQIKPNLQSAIIAGACGSPGYQGDGGPAANATLNTIGGAFVDPSGVVYFADTRNNRVRKISADGTITTVAGDGQGSFSGDGGPATRAALNGPRSVVLDAAGNLYIADTNNNRIRKVSADGTISTLIGNGQPGFSGDGAAPIGASLNAPRALALDSSGALYIADTNNNRIRMIGTDGNISTFAGNGQAGFSGDGGAATSAALNLPNGVSAGPSGTILIADTLNRRVRQVDSSGRISTIAGDGTPSFVGDENAAANAFLFLPQAIASDQSGNMYIADTGYNRVRKVSPNGKITTVAGYGLADSSGDGGLAVNAALNAPQGVAIDASGNVFIADTKNQRIRQVTPDGKISTIAGTGANGFSGDGGQATRAAFAYPAGIAVDGNGEIYVADMNNNRIRKILNDGSIRTVAGNGQQFSVAGDGGPAVQASITVPQAVAVDSWANLYITDTWSSRVRKVTAAGTITTIAGDGSVDTIEDSVPATQTLIVTPKGIAADALGNVYIAEPTLNRVRRIDSNGIIHYYAGAGTAGYMGDGGPAGTALLNGPAAVAVDPSGNVYIADQVNNRIRRVSSGNPAVLPSSPTLSFTAQSGGPPPAAQGIVLQSSVLGRPFQLVTETSDLGYWLFVTPSSGYAPTRVQVSIDPTAMPPGSYNGAIRIQDANGIAGPQLVQVNLTVLPANSPALVVLPTQLSFSVGQNTKPAAQLLVVSAQGNGALPFQVDYPTVSGGNWLGISPTSSITSGTFPSVLTISADPGNLSVGTYQGQITISAFGIVDPVTVPVTLEVRGTGPRLKVSQTGLYFESVAGISNGTLAKTLYVINSGDGVAQWQASAVSQTPGINWLSLTTAAGSANASAATPTGFDVQVDASNLIAGLYQGSVVVSPADSSSSPLTVNVLFRVLPSGTVRLPELGRTGMVLFSSSGVQKINVLNPNPDSSIGYQIRAMDGDQTLDYTPRDGVLNPASVMQLAMKATGFLSAGFLERKLELLWSAQNLQEIRVVEVSTISGCTPSEYRPVFLNATNGFTARLGEPFPIEVFVADDCGHALTTGAVMATFQNGDAPMQLIPLGDGRWTGTWVPSNPAPYGARITVWALAATGLYDTETLEGVIQQTQSQ